MRESTNSVRGMTEVPEHLLRRSRERREAMGLSGSGDASGESGGGESQAGGGAGGSAPTAPGGDVVEQPAAAATPAIVDAEPEAEITYVAQPDPGRSKNPLWVMP